MGYCHRRGPVPSEDDSVRVSMSPGIRCQNLESFVFRQGFGGFCCLTDCVFVTCVYVCTCVDVHTHDACMYAC